MQNKIRRPEHNGAFVRKLGGWGAYMEFLKTYKAPKIGRNQLCPCGSVDAKGKRKKYKKCCGGNK